MMEVETFVRNAMHSGILERVIDDDDADVHKYKLPIPSLTTYMACRGHKNKVMSILRDAFEARMLELNSKKSRSRV